MTMKKNGAWCWHVNGIVAQSVPYGHMDRELAARPDIEWHHSHAEEVEIIKALGPL